jgi:hypothetical protein
MTTRYIAETKWRVQLQTGAPTLQTFEKVLDAPSQEIAIHRASASYPNMQFIQVQASQLDPQSGGPAGQSGTNTPTATGQLPGFRPLQPLQGLTPLWPQGQQQQPQESRMISPKSFAYPYSISLPNQFARVLKETAPVAVLVHDGHHSIILENEHDMQGFLSRLKNHSDRQIVNTIIAGIRSSIR